MVFVLILVEEMQIAHELGNVTVEESMELEMKVFAWLGEWVMLTLQQEQWVLV